MGIKSELGKKIKRMRLNRGLTQEQLAEAIDVSQRTLSGIEIGENFVTAETLDKLIKALNTTTDELFALNHLRDDADIKAEIINDVEYLSNDKEKLKILYNIVKGLIRE
ncbi:helix-turn-helix transcriptional regulator [bacterium]|nr:helix-turn-helix transcriptional regulator [bacterium]